MKKDLIVIATCIFISSIFHIIIPWNTIMTNPIQFNTPDAYYWMIIADQFPNHAKDYFINYPIGIPPSSIPLWPNMIAIFANIFDITVSQSGAILPAILGIVTIVPVYYICKQIFNRTVAVGSCLILSIMPGSCLTNTQIGAADHHALEIFMLSLIMMLVVILIKYKDINWFRGTIIKPLIGVVLICSVVLYTKVWGGWMLVIFIIGLWLLVSALIKMPKIEQRVFSMFIVSLIGLVIVIVVPEAVNYLNKLSLFWNWDVSTTIGEEIPLLFKMGVFSMDALWGNYSVVFYFALIGLGILGYRYYRNRDSGDLLMILWALTILLITLSMKRFTYYLAVNVAMLGGYSCWLLYCYIKVKTKSKVIIGLLMATLVIFISIPMVRQSVSDSTSKINMMSQGWVQSLRFLRTISNQDAYIKGSKIDYGVLSWWDYGYWIVREAHMPVLCSPGQGDRVLASKILTSDDDSYIKEQLKAKQIRYIIVDDLMLNDKRYAIRAYAGIKELDKGVTYITQSWSSIGVDMFIDRLYGNQVDYCQLVFQSNEVKVFEVR